MGERGTIFLTPMHTSSKTVSLLVAFVISACLVTLAFFLSSSVLEPKVADAESTRAILEAYARKDTDADGLADWQEKLYGTDPMNPSSIKEGVVDGDAVAQGLVEPRFASEEVGTDGEGTPMIATEPLTLTDRFSQEFFGNYLLNRTSKVPTEEDLLVFIESAINDLNAETRIRAAYDASDVIPGGSGRSANETYTRALGTVLTREIPENKFRSVPEYLFEGIAGGDSKAYQRLAQIGKAYSATANALMKLAVPKEVVHAHLRTANAYAQLGEVINNLSLMEEDPLLALVALNRYDAVAKTMAQSLFDLSNILAAAIGPTP